MCKLGKTGVDTLQALQIVYGDNALKKKAVYDWYNLFKSLTMRDLQLL
jgi:ABC-type uncharacterized transport system permease subunit